MAFAVRSLLSHLYALGVRIAIKRQLRSSRSLDCLVISIGNITAGGTGKTPLVAHIARHLRGRGYRVGIILRGYRGRLGGGRPVMVSAGAGPLIGPEESGDEAYYMAGVLMGCVVAVGADRFRVGKLMLEAEKVEVILLDDGFQAGHLARDIDILCVNSSDPFGGGRLLPAGLLREPVSAVARADGVCLTRIELVDEETLKGIEEEIGRLNPGAWVLRSGVTVSRITELRSGEDRSAGSLTGDRIYLLSGLGDNRYFQHTAGSLGVEIVGHAAFPDHHKYDSRDIGTVLDSAGKAGAAAMLTSAKDAVRLRSVVDEMETGADLLVLHVEPVIVDESPLIKSIDRLMEGA